MFICKMTYKDQLLKQREEKDSFFKNSKNSPLTEQQKHSFNGLKHYPPNQQFRYQIELKQYEQQNKIDMMTSKGIVQEYIRFGYVEFEVSSKIYSLTVFKQPNSDYLFVPFKDKTCGIETYDAGRYVELEKVSENMYLLDFNLAYNPYCAYNDNWICPLTPFENRLEVEIRSGEKNFPE